MSIYQLIQNVFSNRRIPYFILIRFSVANILHKDTFSRQPNKGFRNHIRFVGVIFPSEMIAALSAMNKSPSVSRKPTKFAGESSTHHYDVRQCVRDCMCLMNESSQFRSRTIQSMRKIKILNDSELYPNCNSWFVHLLSTQQTDYHIEPVQYHNFCTQCTYQPLKNLQSFHSECFPLKN